MMHDLLAMYSCGHHALFTPRGFLPCDQLRMNELGASHLYSGRVSPQSSHSFCAAIIILSPSTACRKWPKDPHRKRYTINAWSTRSGLKSAKGAQDCDALPKRSRQNAGYVDLFPLPIILSLQVASEMPMISRRGLPLPSGLLN